MGVSPCSSGDRWNGLDDLGDTDDASTFKHRQPDAGDDRWPEILRQRMQPNHGFLAGIEPLSRTLSSVSGSS